jgi:hypothetical protein
LDSHQQGTPLGNCLNGAYMSCVNGKYIIIANSRTAKAAANVPAVPASLVALQAEFLAVVNACGSRTERLLAQFIYLACLEVAVQKIVAQEEAAKATRARYASIIRKVEQSKVRSSRCDSACATLHKAT